MGLDYNKEAFATLAYGKYNGTERIVGSVAGFPLLARLSNTDAFDIEGGLLKRGREALESAQQTKSPGQRPGLSPRG